MKNLNRNTVTSLFAIFTVVGVTSCSKPAVHDSATLVVKDAGARVTFGSDWSVAPATPIEGIYAAATRRTLDDGNPDGWIPAQKITVEQALHAYTTTAAYASYEEDVKGMLKPGMLADFVLLDRDLTSIPPESIRDTQILRTVVGGTTVFQVN